jgi:GNAT superfamily N-acetyltransferase
VPAHPALLRRRAVSPRYRTGGAADAERVGRFHFGVWTTTYRDLTPPGIIAKLTEPVRVQRWRDLMAAAAPDRALILAEEGDALIGFGLVDAPGHEGFEGRGEVKYLYVDPARHGRGIGRALLGALARHIFGYGYPGVGLGVLDGNDPAIRFYERLGGRRVGDYTDPGPTWRSTNHIYVWDEPSVLIRHAPDVA